MATTPKKSFQAWIIAAGVLGVIVIGVVLASQLRERDPRQVIDDAASAFQSSESYRFNLDVKVSTEFDPSYAGASPGLGDLATDPEEACERLQEAEKKACLDYQKALQQQMREFQDSLTQDVPTQTAVDMSGSGVGSGNDSQSTLDMVLRVGPEQEENQVETITIDGKVYARKAGSEQWILMPSVPGLTVAQNTGPQNIDDIINQLKEFGGEIEDLGTKTIDGVDARGFRAKIEGFNDAMKRQIPEGTDLDAIETAETTIEIWVGDDDLIRQTSMDMTVVLPGLSLTMKMTIDLFDYGVDVDIQEPSDAIPLEDVPKGEEPFAFGPDDSTDSN